MRICTGIVIGIMLIALLCTLYVIVFGLCSKENRNNNLMAQSKVMLILAMFFFDSAALIIFIFPLYFSSDDTIICPNRFDEDLIYLGVISTLGDLCFMVIGTMRMSKMKKIIR